MRGAWVLCGLLLGCGSDPEPRFRDGGGFVFPDATAADGGVAVDLGEDAGRVACAPPCSGGQVCACVGGGCGCRAPAPIGGDCDPEVSGSCAEGSCLIVRENGRDRFSCADGRPGGACSKRDDRCETALGCVCLTPTTGLTDCRCRDDLPAGNIFCDPLVPETCPGHECRRASGPNGVFFVCADGREGDGCEPRVPICSTSLGCTCPLMSGRRVCSCAEPGFEGDPCEDDDGCFPPLSCRSEAGDAGVSTVCGPPAGPDAGTSAGSGAPCGPELPPCPQGERCVPERGVFVCRRI